MKLSRNQKQAKLGVLLYVSLDQGKTYSLVDGFFNSRYEAEKYLDRNYVTGHYRIRGLRMNCTPVSTPADRRNG